MTLKLDDDGCFSVESLRPYLGDKTDLVASYSIEEADGDILLTLFDVDGSKISVNMP